jgi:hypothetical protein
MMFNPAELTWISREGMETISFSSVCLFSEEKT